MLSMLRTSLRTPSLDSPTWRHTVSHTHSQSVTHTHTDRQLASVVGHELPSKSLVCVCYSLQLNQMVCVSQMAPVHMAVSPVTVGSGSWCHGNLPPDQGATHHSHVRVCVCVRVPARTSIMQLMALMWCWKSWWKSSSSIQRATQGNI